MIAKAQLELVSFLEITWCHGTKKIKIQFRLYPLLRLNILLQEVVALDSFNETNAWHCTRYHKNIF